MNNEWLNPRDVVVHDSRELDLTLEKNGFRYFIHKMPDVGSNSDESIKEMDISSVISIFPSNPLLGSLRHQEYHSRRWQSMNFWRPLKLQSKILSLLLTQAQY
jgi:hypothetical protein